MDGREKRIRLADVPRLSWLPGGRKGRKILSVSTVMRWAKFGLKGVTLRTERVGGTLCTTETWLAEFFERLGQPASQLDAAPVRTTTQRHAALAHANAVLEAAGL